MVTCFIGYIGAGNYVGLDRAVGESASPGVRRWLLSGDPIREGRMPEAAATA